MLNQFKIIKFIKTITNKLQKRKMFINIVKCWAKILNVH